MSERDGIGDILQRLRKIRETQGEAAYQVAVLDVAVSLYLRERGGEGLVLDTFPDIDMDVVRKMAETREAKESARKEVPSSDQAMLGMMQAQIPNMKTQAQFNVFMVAFDALRGTLNAYFGGQKAGAEIARDALNKALDMAAKVTDIAESLKEIPEGQRSDEANTFTSPPVQLHEYDEHRSLLLELAGIKTYAELQQWYLDTEVRRSKVVSQNLRNELFDNVRLRREELSKLS
jgi:hypothetical protein